MTPEQEKLQRMLLSLDFGEAMEVRYERIVIGKEPPIPEGFERAGVMLLGRNFLVRILARKSPLNKSSGRA